MKIVERSGICSVIDDLRSRGFAIVCLGTYIRSDDRASLDLCEKLIDMGLEIPVIICEHGIENCSHTIIEMNIKRLAIFDAAILDRHVDGIVVVSVEELDEEPIALSTHSIPLGKALKYIDKELGGIEVIIVGIPVKNLDIGLEVSSEVEALVQSIAQCFSMSR